MICCYEMRKGRGSCVEPSSLKNFGSMFDAEAIHAQIPSNIEPNYQIDLNVRRNQPQCSNFALNIRTRQSHCGSCRSKGGRCRGTNGNSSYIFSAEKCTFIIKYSKAWKWCRTFSANFFDLNVRHLTCLRSFCVEHSGQLPRISKGQAIDGKPETKGRVYENWICPGLQTGAKRGITGRCASGGFSPFRKGISYFWSGQMRRQDVLRQYAHR